MDLSQRDWIMAGIAAGLGFAIGVLTAFSVNKEVERDRPIFQAATAVVDGGCVLAVFHLLTKPHDTVRQYWFYPIGIVIGFLVGRCINESRFGR
jgi:hypothetical protein